MTYRLLRSPQSWSNGSVACRLHGAELARVDSASNEHILSALLKIEFKRRAWVGGQAHITGFRWLDATPEEGEWTIIEGK